MDDSLLLEVRGRSLTLSAYSIESKVQSQLDADLVAFAVRADREGITPKQRELQMNAIIDKAFEDSEESLLLATAGDVLASLKLVQKHLG